MCSGPLLAGSDPRRRGGAWDPPLGCGSTLERVEGKEGGRGVRLPPHPLLPPPPAFSFLLLNAKCKNNFYIFYFFFSLIPGRATEVSICGTSPTLHFIFISVQFWPFFGVREKKRSLFTF